MREKPTILQRKRECPNGGQSFFGPLWFRRQGKLPSCAIGDLGEGKETMTWGFENEGAFDTGNQEDVL